MDATMITGLVIGGLVGIMILNKLAPSIYKALWTVVLSVLFLSLAFQLLDVCPQKAAICDKCIELGFNSLVYITDFLKIAGI